jgi:hypothetical protein
MNAAPPFDPLWFVPAFALLWLLAAGSVAWLSGWRGLARRWRASGPLHGSRFGFSSGSIGTQDWFPMGYRRTLTLVLAEDGLGLEVALPLRMFSPALFIPWADVESARGETFWLRWHAVLRLRGSPVVIRVRGMPAQALLARFEPQASFPLAAGSPP